MPVLNITTNKPLLSPDPTIAIMSSEIAKILGKPEKYVMVILQHKPYMLFACSDAPLAYVELKSIGLPEEQTSQLSSEICALVHEQLDIPTQRIYIEFANAERHMFGWDGRTFAG